MNRNKNIRIKDIAEMAGVSTGTVDRVIHNRGSVSEEVEQKVQKILKKTGYTANPIAQSLGATKDYRIAVILPNPQQDEYWQLASAGINNAKKEWKSYNLHINLFTFDLYNSRSFSNVFEDVLRAKPDAVFTVPMFYDQSLDFFQKLHQSNIPYLLFNTQADNKIEAFNPLGFIGPDLYQSGRVAAELMGNVVTANDDIAVLHVRENIESSLHLKEKEHGFRDYFNEQMPELNITTHSLINDNESFETQISQIMAKKAYKGIFVSTSSATSTAAKVLEKHHKGEIFLMGYDLLDQNIYYLKAGIINFLINQNPKYQAFQGLRYLANHLLLNNSVPPVDWLPIEIITKENYQSFLNENDTNFL